MKNTELNILDEILEKCNKGEYSHIETIWHSEEDGDYDEIDWGCCPTCEYTEIGIDEFKKVESHFKSLFGADNEKWEDECAKWCEHNKICDCRASYNEVVTLEDNEMIGYIARKRHNQ